MCAAQHGLALKRVAVRGVQALRAHSMSHMSHTITLIASVACHTVTPAHPHTQGPKDASRLARGEPAGTEFDYEAKIDFSVFPSLQVRRCCGARGGVLTCAASQCAACCEHVQ